MNKCDTFWVSLALPLELYHLGTTVLKDLKESSFLNCFKGPERVKS